MKYVLLNVQHLKFLSSICLLKVVSANCKAELTRLKKSRRQTGKADKISQKNNLQSLIFFNHV